MFVIVHDIPFVQELEDHPTAEHHLERLRGRLNEVVAQRDTNGSDVSPEAMALRANDVGGVDSEAAAAAHALWTERYRPRTPAQVHDVCTRMLDSLMTESTRPSCRPTATFDSLERSLIHDASFCRFQVCGNTDAVVELQKWLTAWQEASTGAAADALPTTPLSGAHHRKRGRVNALPSTAQRLLTCQPPMIIHL